MKLVILLGTALLLMTGCATKANEVDAAFEVYKQTLPETNADYGPPPRDYQKLIKDHLAKSLKDPDSVKYSEFTKPRKEHAISNRKAVYGYSSCVLVNAKNSYGGYTGNHLFWFFFQNGQIDRVQDTTNGINIIYIGRPINCENS